MILGTDELNYLSNNVILYYKYSKGDSLEDFKPN